MTQRKRIPQITLPDLDDTSHVILGNTILFIHLAYDDSPSNPLKDCDGMGEIEQIDSRKFSGISSTDALSRLYADYDSVPLRYISHGGQCEWRIEYDHEEIYESIMVDIVRRRVNGEKLDDIKDEPFSGEEPDWLDNLSGVWIPDDSTRESYTGQDGLTRREWMVKQAQSACETYTDYCNGSVYGYDIQLHTVRKDDENEIITDRDYYEHHTALEEDSCWGFYGWEYFKDEVLGIVKGFTAYLNTDPQFIARHKDPRVAVKEAIKALDEHIAHVQRQRREVEA